MSKSKYFFGQNILGQVLKLIPNAIATKVVKQTGSDFAVKKFSTLNHLYTMCYTVLADVTGLRHVCDGLWPWVTNFNIWVWIMLPQKVHYPIVIKIGVVRFLAKYTKACTPIINHFFRTVQW